MKIAWWWGIFVCLSGCAIPLHQQPDEATYTILSTVTKQITAVALGEPCQPAEIPAAYATVCPVAPPGATSDQLRILLDECVRDSLALIVVSKVTALICPQNPIGGVVIPTGVTK